MKFFGRVCFVVGAVVLMTSCSSTDSSIRNRNSAIQNNYQLGYSCAQLLTESATSNTTEIRFTLCDNAEMFSIVTPEGVIGAIENQAVPSNREVVVPVKAEVNSEATRLIVKTVGADLADNSAYHSGVHIYDVSLADVTEDEVGQSSPLLGSVHPKVVYDAPSPQSQQTYRASPAIDDREIYASYIEEFVQKWAIVRLTTCHRSVAQARMANAVYQSSALAEAMITAKRMRDRDLFIAINYLRDLTLTGSESINLCAPGELGFNLFTDGITTGYSPIQPADIATSNNIVELAKSHMLLRYWLQAENGECRVNSNVIPNVDVEEVDQYSQSGLELWSQGLEERLRTVADSPELSSDQRTTAQRLLLQIDTLSLVRNMRVAYDGVSQCSMSPAGYNVAVAQPSEAPSATLPPAEPVTESDSNQNLSEVLEVQATAASIPPSQLTWAAAFKAPYTLQVGQTVSRVQLRALARLKTSPKSTVSIVRVGASQKVCKVKSWGVSGLRAGSCKVKVTVKTPGKKTQSKIVSLSVTK